MTHYDYSFYTTNVGVIMRNASAFCSGRKWNLLLEFSEGHCPNYDFCGVESDLS